ncbi:uncharacterized protein LY89DRAFT_150577 [Mollisia scopiformis]|uniref:Alternative oxidase n=1 Tax=Mollisia scopiformis TaxID=149040 RepID=A0A194X1Q9_MOLSC|nr:uncharacterized protein LY89DRAFT_150577 [Mollisia scopiformis]KUJ13919.1 hypothetical protein LY89DRAFT_150577 [Mollisia scopiformis]
MATRLSPRISRRYGSLAAFLLLLFSVWLWVAVDRPYNFPSHIGWNIYSNSPQSDVVSEDIFDYPPVHSSAIKAVCAATQWNESLVFTCDDNVGGIGHVRNSILNCVRFSIAAGAGLVLPRISVRNDSDISIIHTGSLTNMAYLFDTRHFIDSISLSCPGLTLYPELDDFKKINNANNPIRLSPQALGVKFPKTGMEDPKKFATAMPKAGMDKPEKWGELFHEWYADIGEQYQFIGTTKGPIFIALLRSYLTWPILSDGQAFSTQFGKILKLRADARSLATKVVKNMAEKHKFAANVHAPILENSFWGVHLRTESDALESLPEVSKDRLYPTYAMQTKLYLDFMTQERNSVNSSLVYVASGDPAQVANFWKDAKVMNWTVTTKVGLLRGKDLAELNDLTWDQQALVDFMVLAKASRFLGVGHSGFDWALTGRRTVSLSNKNGTKIDSARKDDNKEIKKVAVAEVGESAFLNQLFGAKGEVKAYKTCLWP